MGKILADLIERLRLAVFAGVVITVLHLYGGLGMPASILLGGGFAIVGAWLFELGQFAKFKPYRLIIGIKYAALWEDLNLVPAAEAMAFENVTLTALSPSVFARSDDRQYSAQPDIYKDVPCGAPAWRGGPGEITDVPTFFLRPHRDGYQFGVHVQKEWWEQHKFQLSNELRDRALAYDDTVALGLLPYGYFLDHVRRWNEPLTVFGGFDRKQRRWKTRLEQGGWTFNENHPTHLRHRYLGIGYYEI